MCPNVSRALYGQAVGSHPCCAGNAWLTGVKGFAWSRRTSTCRSQVSRGMKETQRVSKQIRENVRSLFKPIRFVAISSYFILFHPISTFYKVNLMCEEYSKNLPFTLLHWFPCDGVMGVMRVTVLVPGDSWPVVRGGHRWSCPRSARDTTNTTGLHTQHRRDLPRSVAFFWRLKWLKTTHKLRLSSRLGLGGAPSWKDAKPLGEVDTSTVCVCVSNQSFKQI